GVDSIEHGSYLDAESIELFKRTGAYLVPTLLAGRTVVDVAEATPDAFPPAVREKAMRVGPVMLESLGRAHREGVRIAFGTDSGVSRHGDNAIELELMVKAGMSAGEALRSATSVAAALCGLEEEIGTIEAGKAADIIAVEGDPLRDVAEMRRVVFVMRDGVTHVDR
ncbi:MAG: amidohydrolase family protein, partial [Planctomycetota bacterium]|nr:amidohydrolase family protein [Planctomycetota bacterium]